LFPPPFYFISPFPNSWNIFNRYHFSIYVHAWTVITPHSLSHTLSPPPIPLPLVPTPQSGPVPPSCSLI
jgi:hypothetical protein